MNPDRFVNITGQAPDPRIVEHMEEVISDMAATVVTYCSNRKAHPSYGYTKKALNEKYYHMEGAIGLYMVITFQSTHAGASTLANFVHESTAIAVRAARDAWKSA